MVVYVMEGGNHLCVTYIVCLSGREIRKESWGGEERGGEESGVQMNH